MTMTTTNITLTVSDDEFESFDASGDATLPDVICGACAKTARLHTATGTVAVHCVHTETGAWRIHGEWSVSMVQPISAGAHDRRTRQSIAMGKAQLMYERGNNPEQ
jgi:hypothetical protein